MATGKVVGWKADKGYGFIKPDADGPDVFLHVAELTGTSSARIKNGVRVQYQLVVGERGPKATIVMLAPTRPQPVEEMADFLPPEEFGQEILAILSSATERIVDVAKRHGWVGLVSTRQSKILEEIGDEREAQDRKWGQQNHPAGTGEQKYFPVRSGRIAAMNDEAHAICDARAGAKRLTWLDILTEEFFEYAAADDPGHEREELVQLAACCVARIEHIDRGGEVKPWTAPTTATTAQS